MFTWPCVCFKLFISVGESLFPASVNSHVPKASHPARSLRVCRCVTSTALCAFSEVQSWARPDGCRWVAPGAKQHFCTESSVGESGSTLFASQLNLSLGGEQDTRHRA